MTVGVVRVEWSGTTGGPGLTQFAMTALGGSFWTPADAQSAVDDVREFLVANQPYIPNEVNLQVMPDVDQYDELTGQLTATTTAATTPASLLGGATGTYAGGCGYRYNWRTGAIRNGRRVNGRTYIVPAATTIFSSDGTLGSTQITTFNTAAATFLSSLASDGLALMVWSRPNETTGLPGAMTGVATGDVADKSAILRTRRD